MYQRIVCFKFNSDVTEEAVQQHMAEFAALKDSIPQIMSYSSGLTEADSGGKTPEYDSLHYLTFESMDAIAAYVPHAAHQAFVQANSEKWEKVLVLNSKVDA